MTKRNTGENTAAREMRLDSCCGDASQESKLKENIRMENLSIRVFFKQGCMLMGGLILITNDQPIRVHTIGEETSSGSRTGTPHHWLRMA